MNLALLMEPSKILKATIPSVVSTGRIECRTPRRNVDRSNWRHPDRRPPVWVVCGFPVDMAFINENEVVRIGDYCRLYLVACPDPLVRLRSLPGELLSR